MTVRLILQKSITDYNACWTGESEWKTLLIEDPYLESLLAKCWHVAGAEVDQA